MSAGQLDASERPEMDTLVEAIAILRELLDIRIAKQQDSEHFFQEEDGEATETIARVMRTIVPLKTLGQAFELSLFEATILLCCAAQAIHPEFPDLLAIANKKAELNYTTFQLAIECFPEPHWDALTESSPLRRWQLIHCAKTPELPRASLQIDEAILHYLMGEPYGDPLLSKTITAVPVRSRMGIVLQPSYETIMTQAVSVLQGSTAMSPIVELCGSLRQSQRQIAIRISQQLRCPLYSLSSRAIPRDRAEMQTLAMRWQRWFALAPGLLAVEVNDRGSTAEQEHRALVDAFLCLVQVPAIAITGERLHLSHEVVLTFDVLPLNYQEQLELWQMAWEEDDRDVEISLQHLAAQFRISAATIEMASTAVQSELDLTPADIGDRLWEFCRLQTRPALEGLAQRIEANITWDDFVLPEREKAILQTIVTHVRQQSTVYQDWGFSKKHKRGLGLSVLFAGSSGTGKTTAAEVLACQLKLDLFRIDLSAVVSKYIGETEKNLRQIFDAAEQGGAILLFDEADALFGSRTEVKDSHDRHANIEVSYLLQRMEAYQGLAILTTNFRDNLDRAFIRRLRFIVNFPYPKAPERSQIWERSFPKQTPTKDLNFQRLGQLDVAGGNIKSIALNAAFIAAEVGEPVMMKHILEAARTEYMKWGQSLGSAEIRGWNLSE